MFRAGFTGVPRGYWPDSGMMEWHDFGLCARGPRLLAPPGSHWPMEKWLMGEDSRDAWIAHSHYATPYRPLLDIKCSAVNFVILEC